jgi:chemosensory pili system protein ChpE
MSLFSLSIWIGIVFCAPPGAITAEAIRRGVRRGFLPALFVEFGSLIGDATWATIALVGLAFLVQNGMMRLLLALIGAALLFYLARSALLDAHSASARPGWVAFTVDLVWTLVAVSGLLWLIQGSPPLLNWAGEWLRWLGGVALFLLGWWRISIANPAALPQTRGVQTGGDFATGAALSLGNPWNIVFWVGIGSKQLALLENPQTSDYIIFFAGFMTGAVIWCFLVAGLVAWGRQYVTPTFFRRVNLVCGLLLGVFALQLIGQLVGG